MPTAVVVDLTTRWPQHPLPESSDLTVVLGRARHGWTVSLATSADTDHFFEVVPGAGGYASWRRYTLTITAPSGQAAQFVTGAGVRGWRPPVREALAEMFLDGPLVHVFEPATDAQRDAGWRAVQILFAALRGEDPLQGNSGGPLDPQSPLAWAAAGFTNRERSEWSAWMDDPATAAQYRLAGFTAQDACTWSGPYQRVPADRAAAFRDAGWAGADLAALSFAVCKPNVDGSEVLAAWLAVPAPGPVVAAAHRAGLTAAEATTLARSGGLNLDGLTVLAALRPAA